MLVVSGGGSVLVNVSVDLVAIVVVVLGDGVAMVLVVVAVESVFEIVDDESTAELQGSC